MLSIIIPAKNEEKCLPILLKSIRDQKLKEVYEIIVADADSIDSTKKIARRFGCKIVKGGLPSVGRNSGARHATGEILLFLDADAELPSRFLRNTLQEFCAKNLVVATTRTKLKNASWRHRIAFPTLNFLFTATERFAPLAMGSCIFSLKSAHRKASGFNKLAMYHQFLPASNTAVTLLKPKNNCLYPLGLVGTLSSLTALPISSNTVPTVNS